MRTSSKYRLRFGFALLILTGIGCSDQIVDPPQHDAAFRSPVPRYTSALSSTLDPSTFYVFQIVPGMYRAFAVNDQRLIVGDDGGNNIASAWSPTMGLVVIGRLDGTTACCSSLNDVNSSGEAIGWSSVSGGTIPMRWSASTNQKFDPGVGGSLFGQGINEAGDIVGGEWPSRAVYKPYGGPAVVLQHAPGITGGYAFDLNESRMIVGDAFVGSNMVAVMWASPTAPVQSLGTLGGLTSRAWQVSDEGEIVGWAQTASGVKHAFLWTSATGMIDLATWPNSCSGDSEAFAINNAGIIAGRCNGRPVLWTAAEGMRYLPTGTSSFGEATALNNLNDVIGTIAGRGVALWKISLEPPTADAGGPYAGMEGSPIALNGSRSSDPEGGALIYSWNFGDPTIPGGGQATGVSALHAYPDNGSYTATLTVTDPTGLTSQSTATVTVGNLPPVVLSIGGPIGPVAAGSLVTVSGYYSDPGSSDTHTVSFDWDANGTSATSAGTTSSGVFSGAHHYVTPGVYTVRATVTDDEGEGSTAFYQYVVIYDSEAGFVTGGGWINSPEDAYPAAPWITGRATFGFISRYEKGKTIPSGQTEFQFRAASIDFKSTSYDWLVIAGRRAQYKGSGRVNGQGDYAFILTGEDGNLQGGDGHDRIRIKIWDRTTGEILYDNQAGDSDDAAARTVLGGGRIEIHPR